MDCPVCLKDMIILEYEDVEIDYCPQCEGIWLDSNEVELLYGDVQACADFLSIGSPVNARDEKPRNCPVCKSKMTKEGTESNPPVIFDHCPKKHGLWFDRGELGEILSHSQTLKGKGTVTDFLKKVFSPEQSGSTEQITGDVKDVNSLRPEKDGGV